MADNATNTAANAVETPANYTIKGVVNFVQKLDNGRVQISIDKSFVTIDFVTKQPKETNSTSFKARRLTQLVGSQIPMLQLAQIMSGAKAVNSQIIALCLTNAEIEFTRVFKKKGEAREETNDTYESDCYTTSAIKVTPHINEQFMPMLQMLLQSQPAEKENAMPSFNLL